MLTVRNFRGVASAQTVKTAKFCVMETVTLTWITVGLTSNHKGFRTFSKLMVLLSGAEYAETIGIEVCRNGRLTKEYDKLYKHFRRGHLLTREDIANYPVTP